MRIAVVGAGIAGIACASVLVEAGHDVRVLDRGAAPGGRMASPLLADRVVDVGASYFTVREPAFQQVVDNWAALGLARAWTDRFHIWDDGLQDAKPGPIRWAAPAGLGSLVADLAGGLDVQTAKVVQQVQPGAVDGEAFDAVVLAMPDPEALAILNPALTEERQAISGRAWAPATVVAARWERRVWEWEGLFVHGSEVLEWVADDGARRGDGAAVLTAHSTAVGPSVDQMLDTLSGLGLPAPVDVLEVRQWTYAKPVGTREALFFLSTKGIGMCGDGWGNARIEAAWLSGTALGRALSGG